MSTEHHTSIFVSSWDTTTAQLQEDDDIGRPPVNDGNHGLSRLEDDLTSQMGHKMATKEFIAKFWVCRRYWFRILCTTFLSSAPDVSLWSAWCHFRRKCLVKIAEPIRLPSHSGWWWLEHERILTLQKQLGMSARPNWLSLHDFSEG